MAYLKGGSVEASDYNNIISASTGFNGVWGIGNGSSGYGQSSILPNVSLDDSLAVSNWANLYDKIIQLGAYQNTPVPLTYTRPLNGQIVYYVDPLGNPTVPGSLIQSLHSNTGNIINTGSIDNEEVEYPNTYTSQAVFYFYVQFSNADKARYFFNAGGVIYFTFQAPSGNTVNSNLSSLATQCGQVYINQTNTSQKKVGKLTLQGVTRIGGSGATPTINPLGYYQLNTSYTQIFRQNFGSGANTNTNIRINARTNGPQGINGDNGDIVEFQVIFQVLPSPQTMSSGAKVKIFTIEPSSSSSSGIVNTWGPLVIYGEPVI